MADADRWLVERARDGDRDAQSGLFERYRLRVVRFCLTFAPIREPDAHDITQEVFIRALGGIRRLREVERFESWLFSIARRRCMTFLRKARKRTEEQRRYVTEPRPASEDTAESRERRRERQIVAEEIERMPASSMKEAGRLFYLDGQDTGEIAERMQAPVSTVTTWLSRFRGRIRKRLLVRILALRGHEVGENS